MKRTITLLALAVIVGTAGCGSESETETQTVTEPAEAKGEVAPLSKAEYIAASDEICGRYEELAEPLDGRIEDANDDGDYEAAADVIEEAVDLLNQQVDEHKALAEPVGADAPPPELDEARTSVVAIFSRLEDALRDEDQERVDALAAELESAEAEIEGIDAGYGFQVCGKD